MKRLLALVAALGAAAVPLAAAHGPPGGGVGYVSTYSSLQPPVFGVRINVLGGDDRLQLVNYSGKPIVVYGYDGEPFLRFAENAVWQNVNSPTTYLTADRDVSHANVPAFADPTAAPSWRKVARGSTFVWHDRRIRWTGAGLPPVVEQAPDESHLIFRWHVPASADGERFRINGFLGYAPPADAEAEGGSGSGSWLIPALAAAVVIVLVAVGVGARRVRRAP